MPKPADLTPFVTRLKARLHADPRQEAGTDGGHAPIRAGKLPLGAFSGPIMLAAGLGVLALLIGGGFWIFANQGEGRAVVPRLQSDLATLERLAEAASTGPVTPASPARAAGEVSRQAAAKTAMAPAQAEAAMEPAPSAPAPAVLAAEPARPAVAPVPLPASSIAAARTDPLRAAGKATVQLATAASRASATSEVHRLQRRLPAELGHRELTVSRTEMAGRVFWLVRTSGFAAKTQAAAFCQRLHAKGFRCTVVAAE
jgi:hypothetical protein